MKYNVPELDILMHECEQDFIDKKYTEVKENNPFDKLYEKLLNYPEETKIYYLLNVSNSVFRRKLLLTMSDSSKKKYLNLVSFIHDKEIVFNSINDKSDLIKYIKYLPKELALELIKPLNDNDKVKYLKLFKYEDKIEIIRSIKDQRIKKKILNYPNIKFSSLYLSLLATIEDPDYIYRSIRFLPHEAKAIVLRFIKDQNIREKVVKRMKIGFINELYDSIRYKDKLIERMDVSNINFDIDPRITIGVELEAVSLLYGFKNIYGLIPEQALGVNKFLSGWNIKEDITVKKGLEITSPILRFNAHDLKELYYVCDLLRRFGFTTNETCGGHIHLGYDYFESPKELKTFLNIYNECENIFYLISNKADTKMRKKVDKYAKSFQDKMVSIKNLKVDFDKIKEISEVTELIRQRVYYIGLQDFHLSTERYNGLNLINIGNPEKNTIEFRMPNGEIRFNELIYNIKLFCKLLEISKRIANSNNKELLEQYYLLFSSDEETKLNILLDLMFNEEEKEIYRERYNKNIKKRNLKIKSNGVRL